MMRRNNGSSSSVHAPPTKHVSSSSSSPSTYFLYPTFPVWNKGTLQFECLDCEHDGNPLILRINQGELSSHKFDDEHGDDDKKKRETSRKDTPVDKIANGKKSISHPERTTTTTTATPSIIVPPPPTPVYEFVWAAGAIMTKIVFTLRHIVQDKSVLELGSGTGIGGITAAACGAKKVVITDLPCALPRCKENVMQNWKIIQSRRCGGGSDIKVEILDWAAKALPDLFSPNYYKSSSNRNKEKKKVEEKGDVPRDDRYNDENNTSNNDNDCSSSISTYPDLIITADCIYSRELWPLLLRVFRAYSGPKTKILMVEGIRGSVTSDFFEKVKAEFSVVPVESLLQPLSSYSSSSSQCISKILHLYNAQAYILKKKKSKNMKDSINRQRLRRGRDTEGLDKEEKEEDNSASMIQLHGILTQNECKELLGSVCKEEQEWNMDVDSVDGFPQDQHDVYGCPSAISLIKQIDLRVQAAAAAAGWGGMFQRRFGAISSGRNNNAAVRLVGHFIRRYSAGRRLGFRPHCDSSLFTVNLALSKASVDYEGCDLVVYNAIESKRISQTVDAIEKETKMKGVFSSEKHQSLLLLLQQMGLKPTTTTTSTTEGGGGGEQGDVQMSSVKLDFDQHSKEMLRRKTVNLSQGDALMHEGHGIYHGVTSITKGTRFVLILFYDLA